jgi:hypothetical protein
MPDGATLLATAGDDWMVRLWNPTTDPPTELTGHPFGVVHSSAADA